MRILGIETSCDETAAAVVENGAKILSDVVASSVELHKKTGGIIPEVAAREQIKYIIPVIESSLKKGYGQPFSHLTPNIDAIAITVGPGLIGSLLVGVETAKTLSYIWKKPVVPINHLQAHLYANWLAPNNKVPKFPAIGLVVSGGHTDLVLIKGHGKIKRLGGTRDDAAGECFDKTARALGLPYPGGPEIAKLAEKGLPAPSRRAEADGKAGNSQAYDLPRPMMKQKNLGFSFSGLKTAVINLEKKEKKIKKADMAASIQQAIIDVLVEKTIRAAKKYRVKSVLLAGGVAANKELREQMQLESRNSKPKINLHVPPPKLCTDNATYIASCAYFNFQPIPPPSVKPSARRSWQKIQADPSLSIEEMIK